MDRSPATDHSLWMWTGPASQGSRPTAKSNNFCRIGTYPEHHPGGLDLRNWRPSPGSGPQSLLHLFPVDGPRSEDKQTAGTADHLLVFA